MTASLYDALASTDINNLLRKSARIIATALSADRVLVQDLNAVDGNSRFSASIGWERLIAAEIGGTLVEWAQHPDTGELEDITPEDSQMLGRVYIPDNEESDLPEKLKVVIFRVVQEALDNIARHSEAGHVDVSLRRQGESVDLSVQDDGIGLNLEDVLTVDDSLRGMGLSGMLERVELLGGMLRIDGEKGKGTRILASWPIRSPEAR